MCISLEVLDTSTYPALFLRTATTPGGLRDLDESVNDCVVQMSTDVRTAAKCFE